MNHQLKLKQDWRKLTVSGLLDNLHDLVRLQFLDLRRSLHGEGDYVLAQSFAQHHVTYQVWTSLAQDSKDNLYHKLLCDYGSNGV